MSGHEEPRADTATATAPPLAARRLVALACLNCACRFAGPYLVVTPCPRCGEVDVIEAAA